MKRAVLILIAVGASTAGLIAQSQTSEAQQESGEAISESRDAGSIFRSWDADEDERLDEIEFSKAMTEVFVGWDEDEDGGLSRREWKQRISQNYGFREYESSYGEWDANKDEAIDPDEFATGLFMLFDDNEDGYIASDEYRYWTWEDDRR